MSILDALKNLVIKRGGTPKGSNIAEVIDDLADIPIEPPSPAPTPSGGSWMSFTEDPTATHNVVTMTTDEAKRIIQNGEPFMIYAGTLTKFLCVHDKRETQTVGTYTELNCALYGAGLYGEEELRKGIFVVESGWERGYFKNDNEITGITEYGLDSTRLCLRTPALPVSEAQDFDGFYLRYDSISQSFRWVQNPAIYVLSFSDPSVNLMQSALNATILALMSGQSTEYAYHDVTTDSESITLIRNDVLNVVDRGIGAGKTPFAQFGDSLFTIKSGSFDLDAGTYGAINVSGVLFSRENGVAVAEIDINGVLAFDSSGASITTNGKLLWSANS